jgi:GTP-binding protein EngB required for normal cell division
MFVESYESKVYEYFIRILSTSQTSILFFGGSKIGKSALIKHYLRNHTKNHVIMQLIDPFKSCSKAINDIL